MGSAEVERAEPETAELEAVRRSGWPRRSKVGPSDHKDDDRTTVSLRSVPRRYTREMVMELLDEHGFAGRYDFLYLPTDFNRMISCGFAFLNMISHVDAVNVQDTFSGFGNWAF